MILTSFDGARLEITPVGFEHDPAIALGHDGGLRSFWTGERVAPDPGECGAQPVGQVWLDVRIGVRLPDGRSWSWVQPCLQVDELADLACWLGDPTAGGVEFVEPMVRFERTEPGRVRVWFDGPGGRHELTLQVPAGEVAARAAELVALHLTCTDVLARLVCPCTSAPHPEAVMSDYTDKIKAKIKESDVEGKLSGLVDEGEKLVSEGMTKAGDLAHDKRDELEGWLDKASGVVNEKTEGKYADKVSKVRDVLLGGLDKLAERRTGGSEGTDGEPLDPRELRGPDGDVGTGS